jgi:hypothetical protein
MKIIGLIPGAMKPFHAGHNHLIQMSIEECDHTIVFTSIKNRGIIDGSKMLDVWDKLILPLLPNSIEVVAVKSPVRGVYDYLEWQKSPDRSFRIYGGTEDFGRLSKARILQYYPCLNVVNVAEENPKANERGLGYTGTPAKGEWVRESIKAGDHGKFRSFLPDFLKSHAKEYLKILTS